MSISYAANITADASGRRRIRGSTRPADLLEEMAAEDWRGPRSEAFASDLWIFGWDVIRGLVGSGRIGSIPATLPALVLPPEAWFVLGDSTEEREQVVLDTLIKTIPTFIRSLEAGRYEPKRGASLETFFVGACGIQFRDVAKSWHTRQHRRQYELGAFDWDGVFGGMPSADVERRIDMRRLVAAILKDVSPQQRIVLVHCLLEGRSHGEVAEMMGVTSRSVEGHLYRARSAAYGIVSPKLARWILDGEGAGP